MDIKKILTLSIITLSCLGLTGCGDEPTLKHECRLFDVEGKAATCVNEGVIAHQHCIYCNKRFVDGVEIKEYLLPIDKNNHAHLIDVAEIPAKCNEGGVKAHKQCEDCNTLILDGAPVEESSLVIPSLNGGHSFKTDNICENCDAYQIVHDGHTYVCDAETRRTFVSNTFAAAHPAGTKTDAFAAGFATRMTFATQGSNSVKVVNDGDSWTITDTVSTGAASGFTRFALADSDNKAYVGKAVVSFDIVMNADITMSRFGLRVVDATATDTYKATQPLLYGNNANEENNANRTVKKGDVYRFTYAIETTQEDQFVQLWTCAGGKSLNITVKNLYVFMEGAGSATTPTGTSLGFAKIN